MAITATGNEVVLKDHHGRVMRLAVKELLLSDRVQVIPDGPGPMSDDPDELAAVTLAELTKPERDAVLERAAHIREVLTGYRSGSAELAGEGRAASAMVVERASARVAARFGEGVVKVPSRATAFRVLAELERRLPTFRLSTKRNRDIATSRPKQVYGKLRPTRPGEYLVMDTTRLDVFAFDPFTLKWVQAELTVSMDWYDRCICGLRLTPVSTKAVDAAAVLYQSFRPRPAAAAWPRHAVWPEHGIPRTVLIGVQQFQGPGLATPPVVPETIVVDHGKIYVSEHLTSVCAPMVNSIQLTRSWQYGPGDKGPVRSASSGRCAKTCCRRCPDSKGPDSFSRGEKGPEDDAFFFLDELETIYP